MIRHIHSPTILIYTEGRDDKHFLDRFQEIYDTNFRIRQGKGGTPEKVLEDTLKEIGDFDTRYCIVDSDKINKMDEFLKKVEKIKADVKYELIVLFNKPCIEAINLALFCGDKSVFSAKNCGVLKLRFKDLLKGVKKQEYYSHNLNKALINQNLKFLEGQDLHDLIVLMDDNRKSRPYY